MTIPCQILPLGQAAFYPAATSFNYGLFGQLSVPVTCEIYDNLGYGVYSSSTFIPTIATNTSESITYSRMHTLLQLPAYSPLRPGHPFPGMPQKTMTQQPPP